MVSIKKYGQQKLSVFLCNYVYFMRGKNSRSENSERETVSGDSPQVPKTGLEPVQDCSR